MKKDLTAAKATGTSPIDDTAESVCLRAENLELRWVNKLPEETYALSLQNSDPTLGTDCDR